MTIIMPSHLFFIRKKKTTYKKKSRIEYNIYKTLNYHIKMKRRKTKAQKEKKTERIEALMRIVVFIISGLILIVWRFFVYIFIIINLIYTLISGRRFQYLAELSEVWNTQWYVFQKYIIFLDNRRPFPFGRIRNSIDDFKK